MLKQSAYISAMLVVTGALSSCGGPKTSEEEQAAPPTAESAPAEEAPMTETETAAADTPADLPAGKLVFDKQCAACHAPGNDHPGYMQLAATRGEEFAILEERDDLTTDYVKYIVRHGLNAMPPFKPSSVTEEDLQALADYLAKAE